MAQTVNSVGEKFSGIGMTSQRTRVRMVERLREQGITDEVVLTAMAAVPRHLFVEDGLAHRAYEDTPLPIGHAQTISQPYIVARMAELVRGGRELNRVLEVGTGCGYATAVLSHVAREVYSVERIGKLLAKARRMLQQLRASNVRLKHADGAQALPENLTFDGILVTAVATHVPAALLAQLEVGGRLVLPLARSENGEPTQRLVLIEKLANRTRETLFEEVRFVPLLSGKE
jgi:protein-L-isoaspartate(D-aspartate) O-methyltransferase